MRLPMSTFSLADIPYAMIIHGTNDHTVPLDDSIRLVETTRVGRCRLEVVEDSHQLKSVTEEEIELWTNEVFAHGRENVMEMVQEGSKAVDASIFDALPEEEDSKPRRLSSAPKGASRILEKQATRN
eukprot:GHVT01018973.1.p1 GENE.GHVT01018973.1~~GHVT01018973.1.p1  ORF type:complete len:127 (-),score=20.64 GHVT01018973.1:1293-1673(-)